MSFTILADRDKLGPVGAVRRPGGAAGPVPARPGYGAAGRSARRRRCRSRPATSSASSRAAAAATGRPTERDPEAVLRDVLDAADHRRARGRGPVSGRRRRRDRARSTRPRTAALRAGGGLDGLPARRRHRRHVHRRDPHRRGDRRVPHQQGLAPRRPTPARASSTPPTGSSRRPRRTRRSLRYVVHGTTVATNAIIQRKIARTALITTEGLPRRPRDRPPDPPVAVRHRSSQKPVPLVPRPLCFGVPERLDWHGEVLGPLDEDGGPDGRPDVAPSEGVESVAVCLLHAYANPVHERAGRARSSPRSCPDVAVSLSSNIVPEFREYDRASTVVINAGIQPIVQEYLGSIEERLRGPRRRGRAAGDAERRRRPDLRERRRAAGVHRRVRAGGRGHRHQPPRPELGPGRRHLVRHGRHDGQGRARPRRHPADHQGSTTSARSRSRAAARRAAPATRSGRRSSSSPRSAPAAGRSPGSTPAARCASAR